MNNFVAFILLNKKTFLLAGVLLIAIVLLLLFSSNNNSSVINTLPSPGAENVSTDINPYIVFSKPLSRQGQQELILESSPKVNFSKYWSSDRRTLYLVPNNSLASNTEYNMSISYAGRSYSWSFKTKAITMKPNQGTLDDEFNNALGNFYKVYPWYTKLPPKNSDFSVIFDPQKKEFLAEIYPKTSSSLTIDEQTSQLKNTVLETLKNLGVDLSKYKASWTVSPR